MTRFGRVLSAARQRLCVARPLLLLVHHSKHNRCCCTAASSTRIGASTWDSSRFGRCCARTGSSLWLLSGRGAFLLQRGAARQLARGASSQSSRFWTACCAQTGSSRWLLPGCGEQRLKEQAWSCLVACTQRQLHAAPASAVRQRTFQGFRLVNRETRKTGISA